MSKPRIWSIVLAALCGLTPVMASASPSLGQTALRQAVPDLVAPVQAEFRRSQFMEDTPREIAHENQRNPYQAWALAFFPTAIIKGVALGLGVANAKKERWATFMPIIPSMGISHFYETKVYWAGIVSLAGDLIGGAILAYHFDQKYSRARAGLTQPADTLFYAGIAITAAFFLFENITAPLFALTENKKLKRQFLPRKTKSAWRHDPWPDSGLATVGPGFGGAPPPVGAGWTFLF